MKDPPLKPNYLQRARELFVRAEVVEFPDAGHFVQEEAAPEVSTSVRSFLERTPISMAQRNEYEYRS